MKNIAPMAAKYAQHIPEYLRHQFVADLAELARDPAPARQPKSIDCRSLVAGRNLEPYVQILVRYDDGSEDMVSQWAPQDAFHHATVVLACIEAATSDAFLVAFLTDPAKVGMPLEETGAMLRAFRAWREQRRTPERPV